MNAFEREPKLEIWQRLMTDRRDAVEKWQNMGVADDETAAAAVERIAALKDVYEPYVAKPFRELGDISQLRGKNEAIWRRKIGSAALILAEIPVLFGESDAMKRSYLDNAAIKLVPGGPRQIYSKNQRRAVVLPNIAVEYLPLLNKGRVALGYEEFVPPKQV